jgi:hypothetical protein
MKPTFVVSISLSPARQLTSDNTEVADVSDLQLKQEYPCNAQPINTMRA